MLSGGRDWDDLISRPTTDGANELMYTYGGGEQHALRGDYISDLLARPVDGGHAQHNGPRSISDRHNSIFRQPTAIGAAPPPPDMRANVPTTQAVPLSYQSSLKPFDFIEQMQELRAKVEALSRAAPSNMNHHQVPVAGFGQPSARAPAGPIEQMPPQLIGTTKTVVKRERAYSSGSDFSDKGEPEYAHEAAPVALKGFSGEQVTEKRALELISQWKPDFLGVDAAKRAEVFRKMPSLFGEDGRMLFIYHAVPGVLSEKRLKQFEKTQKPFDEGKMAQLTTAWELLPGDQKAMWKTTNKRFKECLAQQDMTVVQYLDILGHTAFGKMHVAMAKQAIERWSSRSTTRAAGEQLAVLREAAESSPQERRDAQVVEVKAKPSKRSKTKSLPILQHFALDEGWDVYPKQMAQLTLEYIDVFLADAPGLLTRLRWGNTLIDYDPKLQSAEGIWARLSTALSHDRWPLFCKGEAETRAAKVESLLLPFFCMNATNPKFAELIRSKEGYFKHQDGYATKYGLATAWLGDRLVRYQPLCIDNQVEIVRFVLQALRQHVVSEQARGFPAIQDAHQDVESSLRQRANVATHQRSRNPNKRFAIADDENGFAELLYHCFDHPLLDSEEYEDLMEQQLYKFDRYTNGQFELQRRPPAGQAALPVAPTTDVPVMHSSTKRCLEQDAAQREAVKRVKQEASHHGGSSPANPWTPFVAKDPRLQPMPAEKVSPTKAHPGFIVDVVGELPNARFSREKQMGSRHRHGYFQKESSPLRDADRLP